MTDLLKINVSEHTEKKNGLTYLSWAWAWAEVLKLDPKATWEAIEFNGVPATFLPDQTAMVKVVVTINGHSKSCWLPVMNHRNQAIECPNAFQINTAIVRCLTKCISMHGLGLYIYAGEDLPEEDEKKPAPKHTPTGKPLIDQGRMELIEQVANAVFEKAAHKDDIAGAYEEYRGLTDPEEVTALWKLLPADVRRKIKEYGISLKEEANATV